MTKTALITGITGQDGMMGRARNAFRGGDERGSVAGRVVMSPVGMLQAPWWYRGIVTKSVAPDQEPSRLGVANLPVRCAGIVAVDPVVHP